MKTNNDANFILALEQARHNLPEFIDACTLIAQINKSYYDSLVNAGFTKKEAIELVKVQGMQLQKEGEK